MKLKFYLICSLITYFVSFAVFFTTNVFGEQVKKIHSYSIRTGRNIPYPRNEGYGLREKTEAGDTIEIISEHDANDFQISNCRLLVKSKDNAAVELAAWRNDFTDCEDTAAYFISPESVIAYIQQDAEEDLLISFREYKITGELVSDFSISGYDFYDTRNLYVNKQGTIATNLGSKLLVYRNHKMEVFNYLSKIEIEKLSDRDEILLSGAKSHIIDAKNGRKLKSFHFEVSDFNNKHEVISKDGYIVTKGGKFKFNICNFPNSVRLRDFSLRKITEKGIVYGTGLNLDSLTYDIVPFEMRPSKSGYTGKENFCGNLDMHLENTCAAHLTKLPNGGYEPTDGGEAPSNMACTIVMKVTKPDGTPMANETVAVRPYSNQEADTRTTKTNEAGEATISFTFNENQRQWYAVAPFGSSIYRSNEVFIADYHNDGV